MYRQPKLPILLVEDNPDHAMLEKKAILRGKQDAYQVDHCTSVEEAIDKIKAGQYCMIISDYNLPGKTGLQLLEWLNEENMEIPFIMMTGAGDEKIAVQAMRNGAYNYLVKDEAYLNVVTHIVDETFLKHFAEKEKQRFELEIRNKNVALEKANRELKKLDQLKTDFTASVSHDIRSPLNSMQESISLILDGVVNPNDEKGKRVLQIAKRSIDRLNKMINDLLDFSKLDSGKMRLHINPADVQTLIDEAYETLKGLADKKEIRFVFEPSKNFPKVLCDGERILQVLMNLIGNAIKFTPEKGTVSVAASIADGNCVVKVCDTGIGIQSENIANIFGRFEQVKGADSGGARGTGLGLAICKELVLLHRGKIWVESEFGRGSQFIFSIPLHQNAKRIDETEFEKNNKVA
jgi:signal transduction histidine kinase